jgi:uncharacterized protein (DUF1330 family)
MASQNDLDAEAFVAFKENLGKGPVLMLNLLKFKEDGGMESYMAYSEAVAPMLEKVGGDVFYSGLPAERLIGEEQWDLVALVRYPSRGAFLDMVTSDEYQAIAHLREQALMRSVLHATDPVRI